MENLLSLTSEAQGTHFAVAHICMYSSRVSLKISEHREMKLKLLIILRVGTVPKNFGF